MSQKNYKDPNLRDVAREKVASRKAANAEAPKYRDRASERRILFNQPETPLPDKDEGSKVVVKRKFAEVSSHSRRQHRLQRQLILGTMLTIWGTSY
jgi:hypothetical protein